MIDLDENEKDYLQIKLKSDAFKDGAPSFYKENPEKFYKEICLIHKILFRLEKNKPLSINITYKVLKDEKYIDDLLDLFKEWFPFSYDRDYFRKYFVKQSCIIIAAFIKINSIDYIVGCALGEIINDDKFKKILPDVLIENSWFSLQEPESLDCGVLQHLGVIDEYRRLGVGSRLLDMFIEEVKKKEAVSIYVSILDYNTSAINFFENNQWYYYDCKKNYYKINGENYDAKFFYYIINIKKCKKISANKKEDKNDKNKYNGIGAENGVSEIPEKEEKGCLASILNFFSLKK